MHCAIDSIVGWRCMLSVDELVGAVVETISELELLSNTFIFFTCDYVKSSLARIQSINKFPCHCLWVVRVGLITASTSTSFD